MKLLVCVCLVAASLLTCAMASAQVCSETPTNLTTLNAVSGCSQCTNVQLPGSVSTTGAGSTYTLISDLPEVFCTPGVLYASVPVLPPDINSNPPLSLRTQTNPGNSFQYIDNSFDVFLFHTVSSCSPSNPDKRIVIYVHNAGTGAVTVNPKQIMINDGIIGTVHQMESNLGQRELQDNWDTPFAAGVAIPAGTGKVVAYSKRFASTANNSDQSTNLNCFGRVRATVTNPTAAFDPTRLQVYVIAIDGANVSQNDSRALALLNQGARSGEGSIDINTAPSGCQVRRATGVHPTFTWRTSPVTIDVANISASAPLKFQMAMWDLSSGNCPTASQTQDMSLYPGYTRGDTIGNYHVEYYTRFRIINRDTFAARTFDLTFGKTNADVGLAYQVLTGSSQPTDAALKGAPVRTKWAGPNQSATTASLLALDGGQITLNPCEAREIAVRFLVLGNASLPFTLNVERVGADTDIIVDNGAAATSSTAVQSGWFSSANAGFYGANSLLNQAPASGSGGSDKYSWHPTVPAGRYRIYAWWVPSSNRSTAAPFTIRHHGGTSTVFMNQTTGGTQWNLLGEYDIPAGPSSVELSDNVVNSLYVSADAIRWVQVGAFVPVSVSQWELE